MIQLTKISTFKTGTAAVKAVKAPRVFDLNQASTTMFKGAWEAQNPGKQFTVAIARQGKLFYNDSLKLMDHGTLTSLKAADTANTHAALDALLTPSSSGTSPSGIPQNQFKASGLARIVAESKAKLDNEGFADVLGHVKRMLFVVEAESKYAVPAAKMGKIEQALGTKQLDKVFTPEVAGELQADGYSIEKVGGAGADGKRRMLDEYYGAKGLDGTPRDDITTRQRMVGGQIAQTKNDPNATIGRIDAKLSGANKGSKGEVFERLEITVKSLTAAEVAATMAGTVPAEFNPMAQLAKVTSLDTSSLKPLVHIDDSRFEFFLGKGAGPAFRQEYLITADSITGRSPYMPFDSALGTVKLGELEFERSTPPPDAATEAFMHRLSGSIGETFKLKASAMPKATNAAKAIANVQAKAIKSNDWFN